MPSITAIYAALLGLMSVAVAFPAGSLRGKLNISIGDGGNHDLLLAMRRHANFVEWVPLALIVIALLEMNGVTKVAIHSLGAALVIARAAHAIGIKKDTMKNVGRFIGAAGTALIMIVSSVWLLVRVLS
ncbi:MAG TPA: MAPEG family protein [Steroidobacteraceae bacterium]|nr:MAPEG family protein [Steroidobacteraceae bacterium]